MPTVVVTGASSGFGRSITLTFHDAGYDVIATMRDPSRGAHLPCAVAKMDVTDQDSVDRLFTEFGDVDILVNNAGVGAPSSCEELPIADVERVMATNYLGAVRCAKAVLPNLRQRGHGWIVNITSMVGRSPKPLEAAYAASKCALEAWSECLAGELREFGVNVAIIEPGVIKTPLMEKNYHTPTAPYDRQWQRFMTAVLAQLQLGTTPDAVGSLVLEAVTTGQPKLRWTVGSDAARVVERRPQLSDESLLDLCAIESDDAYWKEFARLWGPDLIHPEDAQSLWEEYSCSER